MVLDEPAEDGMPASGPAGTPANGPILSLSETRREKLFLYLTSNLPFTARSIYTPLLSSLLCRPGRNEIFSDRQIEVLTGSNSEHGASADCEDGEASGGSTNNGHDNAGHDNDSKGPPHPHPQTAMMVWTADGPPRQIPRSAVKRIAGVAGVCNNLEDLLADAGGNTEEERDELKMAVLALMSMVTIMHLTGATGQKAPGGIGEDEGVEAGDREKEPSRKQEKVENNAI